ncbi:MAG: hypothetical protein LC749_14410 [Actinobacteria bacterium]|nr:hypothetical protein [Actinomycetota bacterium]
MEVLHVEGLAIHGGPESCVVVREGGSEALTGGRAGWAIEPRKCINRGADAFIMAEGNTVGDVICESLGDPARSKILCTYGSFMRENREVPGSPAQLVGAGRGGKAKAAIP